MLTEPPHIATYDKTVLETGMVITIEPGFVTDYGVFQNEEIVLVTQKGHEILSKASTELHFI
jgi:Xaa-Pro aminopeptidase